MNEPELAGCSESGGAREGGANVEENMKANVKGKVKAKARVRGRVHA